VIGRVRLGTDVGIWFGAVLRGDAAVGTFGLSHPLATEFGRNTVNAIG
jgi:hypothetical protein